MNYEVVAIPNFRKELKKLAKKYPSLKEDFKALLHRLKKNPCKELHWGATATKSEWQSPRRERGNLAVRG